MESKRATVSKWTEQKAENDGMAFREKYNIILLSGMHRYGLLDSSDLDIMWSRWLMEASDGSARYSVEFVLELLHVIVLKPASTSATSGVKSDFERTHQALRKEFLRFISQQRSELLGPHELQCMESLKRTIEEFTAKEEPRSSW